jgi:hypothetical protein
MVISDGGADWRVHYAIFSRSGVTQAALAELQKYSGISVDVETEAEIFLKTIIPSRKATKKYLGE